MIFRMLCIISFTTVVLACTHVNREPKVNNTSDRQQIMSIFDSHDKLSLGLDDYLSAVADDVILMAHDSRVIVGKEAYRQHIVDAWATGKLEIKHELIASYSYPGLVIARGRAVGAFTPSGTGNTYPFETKNVFIFRRLVSGELQVWQIIFNMDPPK